MLSAYCQTSEERQTSGVFACMGWMDTGLILLSTTGVHADPMSLFRNFKLFLRNAVLPDIRFHDLRQTAATLRLQQGIHPKVVQERLGHANIMLTLTTCSQVLPSLQKEAAEKMDNLLMPFEAAFETC